MKYVISLVLLLVLFSSVYAWHFEGYSSLDNCIRIESDSKEYELIPRYSKVFDIVCEKECKEETIKIPYIYNEKGELIYLEEKQTICKNIESTCKAIEKTMITDYYFDAEIKVTNSCDKQIKDDLSFYSTRNNLKVESINVESKTKTGKTGKVITFNDNIFRSVDGVMDIDSKKFESIIYNIRFSAEGEGEFGVEYAGAFLDPVYDLNDGEILYGLPFNGTTNNVFWTDVGTTNKMSYTTNRFDQTNKAIRTTANDSYLTYYSQAKQDYNYIKPTGSYGITFNEDGNLLYMVNGSKITIFTLSQAWDINSAKTSLDINAIAVFGRYTHKIKFIDSKTVFATYQDSSGLISKYILSQDWNLLTATYDSNLITTGRVISPRLIEFNSDGTKLITGDVNPANSPLVSYNLATPYDLTTAIYDSNYYTGSRLYGSCFNDTGKLLLLGIYGASYKVYDLATPYDISTITVNPTYSSGWVNNVDCTWGDDGESLFLNVEGGTYIVRNRNILTPYTIKDTDFNEGLTYSFWFNPIKFSTTQNKYLAGIDSLNLSLYLSNNQIRPVIAGSAQSIIDFNFELSNWHNIVITMNDTNLVIYIDGNYIKSYTSAYSVDDLLYYIPYVGTASEARLIGAYASADVNLIIDDVLVWKRDLNVEEVNYLYYLGESMTTGDWDQPITDCNNCTGTQESIQLDCTDESGTCERTYYKINDGNWQLYNTKINFPSSGLYNISYYSFDDSNNSEPIKTNEDINIVVVPPTTTMSGCTSGWHKTNQTITLTCADGSNTCNKTYYQLNDLGYNEYTLPVLLSTDLNHKINYYSTDIADVNENPKTSYCALDKTSPTTTLTRNGTNVSLSCSDATSGCDKTYYCYSTTGICVPTTEGTSFTLPCLEEELCSYYISYYSIDNATNEETTTNTIINIIPTILNRQSCNLIQLIFIILAAALVLAPIILIALNQKYGLNIDPLLIFTVFLGVIICLIFLAMGGAIITTAC